jgi:peptidyl-prolyl cis-trans isomerase A (cyclophilin A)
MMKPVLAALAIAALAVTAVGAADLSDPSTMTEKAPDSYRAKFETSKGVFVIEVTREWAPIGADRFYNLVKNGFYDDVRFFRVLDGFVVQWGMHGDPAIGKVWQAARIQDEVVKQSNATGTVTFAKGGANSRTTQVFINLADNARLDGMGFPAFGKIVEGMDVVESLYGGYGEGAPRGRGPNQGQIAQFGNEYLKASFPELDYIVKATIEGAAAPEAPAAH